MGYWDASYAVKTTDILALFRIEKPCPCSDKRKLIAYGEFWHTSVTVG
jgi:hypothetical protein